jgi:quinol monooxygenase YgiN
MTYARLTTLQADPTKLDDGARYFREWVTTTGRQQQGFQGARLLVDRTSGKVQIVTLWEGEAAAEASAQAVQQTRTELVERLGGSNPAVELLEMLVNESS